MRSIEVFHTLRMIYPFLASQRERLKALDLKLDDIAGHPIYGPMLDSAALDVTGRGEEETDPELAVVKFTLAKILLSIIGDQEASREYAERKAVEWRERMDHEGLSFLIKVGREEFGMDITTGDSLRIHFTDFLKYKPEFLRLSQADLLNGYVQVSKNQLSWILKERIKQDILKGIPKKQQFPEALEKKAMGIKGKIRPKRRILERPGVSRLTMDALPPCINGIITNLEAGTANHNAHFVLVTFLHGLKLDEAAILEVFRRSPKFKERTARYQIQFAKERGYTCPACESVKGYGLCPSDCPRNNPVANYFIFLKNRRSRPNNQDMEGKSRPEAQEAGGKSRPEAQEAVVESRPEAQEAVVESRPEAREAVVESRPEAREAGVESRQGIQDAERGT